MCRAVACKKCGKTTWAGCGQHVDQVMQGVPSAQRCAGTRAGRAGRRGRVLLAAVLRPLSGWPATRRQRVAGCSRRDAVHVCGQGRGRTADLSLFRRALVPTELPAPAGDEHRAATLTGLEPATSAVTGRRANQLRYRALLCCCRACPQRGSNPCYRLERAASWTTRRWGLVVRRGRRKQYMPPWRTPAGGPEAAKLCVVRNRPRTAAALLLSLLTAPVVLTGCGGGDTDEQSSVGSRRVRHAREQRAPTASPPRPAPPTRPPSPRTPSRTPPTRRPDASVTVQRHPRRPAGRLRPRRVRGRRHRDARAGTSGTSTRRRPRAAARRSTSRATPSSR